MINVALFGFGRIGQMHAENLNKNKEIKLLYVYEKIDQLSNKAKKLYGCKIEKNYNKIFNLIDKFFQRFNNCSISASSAATF